MRSVWVVRASDCQCHRSQHSWVWSQHPPIQRIWGANDEAVLNKVQKDIIKKPPFRTIPKQCVTKWEQRQYVTGICVQHPAKLRIIYGGKIGGETNLELTSRTWLSWCQCLQSAVWCRPVINSTDKYSKTVIQKNQGKKSRYKLTIKYIGLWINCGIILIISFTVYRGEQFVHQAWS